jgi:ATP-dependent DNA ligase
MFEKYDGVRGFWHPGKKAFFSRKGKRFEIPSEIIAVMPQDLFLDGELWYLLVLNL